jgi:deoxyguanosine kinase
MSINISNSTTIISIEGNIGSGKSTLLEKLRLRLENVNVLFLQEPVDIWETIRDSSGQTMLQKFYADQTKYAFSFQIMAYISRLSLLKKAIRENPGAIIITERSLHTDKMVFAKMLFDSGLIEDVNYQIYLKWFDEFTVECPLNKIIYVKAEPEVCFNRIKKRSRQGESNIPLKYLQDCHKYHEEMVKEMEVAKLLLDGNQDIFENRPILDEWIQQIEAFIV